MPQISKVERDHDIKQVSRLEDLKPATEKSVSMATPQIRGKPQINETQQNLQTSVNAARRASIAAIRHAKTISESSDKNEDQEAIDKMEVSARNAAADAAKAKQLEAQADSVHKAYKQYTRQLATQVGEGALSTFLGSLYPTSYPKRMPDGTVVTVTEE